MTHPVVGRLVMLRPVATCLALSFVVALGCESAESGDSGSMAGAAGDEASGGSTLGSGGTPGETGGTGGDLGAAGATGGAGEPTCLDSSEAIASALAAAKEGDQIFVCAGNYEAGWFIDQGVTLTGAGPDVTTLQPATATPMLMLEGGQFVVEGFRFTNATFGAVDARQAGKLTVKGCAFDSNVSTGPGAAIAGPTAGKLVLEDVSFVDNEAKAGSGGAVTGSVVEGSKLLFEGNSAKIVVGAISATESVTLSDSLFDGNAGGAVYADVATLTDVVFKNHTSLNRAPLWLRSGILTRVTFEGGNVEQGGAALQMGAVKPSHPSGAQVELIDCTVVSNDSNLAAAYVFGNTAAGETVATLISKNTDWGSAAASNDNTIADVMLHEVSIDNTRESYSGKASFTCTLSPRKCTVD